MKPTITLLPTDSPKIKLQLSSEYSVYTGAEPVDVVYQDSKYEYLLEGTTASRAISNIELIVNNNTINTLFIVSHEDAIHIQPTGNISSHPFSMVYGITEIVVHIEFTDQTEQYLFSSHLAVALSQRYSVSVKDTIT